MERLEAMSARLEASDARNAKLESEVSSLVMLAAQTARTSVLGYCCISPGELVNASDVPGPSSKMLYVRFFTLKMHSIVFERDLTCESQRSPAERHRCVYLSNGGHRVHA